LLAVMAEQAMLSLRSDRWDEGRALAVETVRLADALGLPPPARALMGTGVEANIHRAVDVALAEGDLRTASNGFYNLAATFQGGYEQMMSAIDAAIAFDVAHGLSGLSARRYRLTGRLWAQPDGEAAELAELAELIGEARASGDAFNALWGELALTQFRMERGESIEAAIDAMAASWQDAALSLSALDFLRAKAALLQGDRARAQGHLEAIVDRLAAGESSPDPGEMVELCVRAGRLDLARWIAENDRPSGLIDGVQPRDDVAALGLARVDFAVGLIVEGEGQPAAALPHLESALATMTRLGWVVVAAGIERCLGRCLLAVGESGPAVEHLLAARETLLLVGFRPQLEEIDALLALVGTS
jgi:hypothetical protein